MSLCVPILCGAPVKIRPEGDERWVLCPNCNSTTAFTALRARWLEFFFIPVIPLSWEHIWFCDSCEWSDLITKKDREQLLKDLADSEKVRRDYGVKEVEDVVQPLPPVVPTPPLPPQPPAANSDTDETSISDKASRKEEAIHTPSQT